MDGFEHVHAVFLAADETMLLIVVVRVAALYSDASLANAVTACSIAFCASQQT
jgi:hypothetical protein